MENIIGAAWCPSGRITLFDIQIKFMRQESSSVSFGPSCKEMLNKLDQKIENAC